MALTVIEQIINAIVAELDKPAYSFGSVVNLEPAALDVDQWADPQCFVWQGTDRPVQGDVAISAVNMEIWRLPVSIAIYGGGLLETYLGKIGTAMSVDPTWGGLALDTTRISIVLQDHDPSRDVSALLTVYEVMFRVAEGDPYLGA